MSTPETAVDGRASGLVVAVDGPSGAGKSSVSREVARRLGLAYLDTGAMYRALTWWLLQREVNLDNPSDIAVAARQPVIVAGTDPEHPTIEVDGIDVAGPIRGDDVTAAVSAVSAVPSVRARMAALQREAIGDGGIVIEGRDIGTVVAPDADVKVYLTASEQARAVRRAAEHSAVDQVEGVGLRAVAVADVPSHASSSATPDVAATVESLRRRDVFDSTRPVSPLRKADDAVEVDATDLTLVEVVEAVTALVSQRCGAVT